MDVLGARVRRMVATYPLYRKGFVAVGRLIAEGANSRVWRGQRKPFLETRIED